MTKQWSVSVRVPCKTCGTSCPPTGNPGDRMRISLDPIGLYAPEHRPRFRAMEIRVNGASVADITAIRVAGKEQGTAGPFDSCALGERMEIDLSFTQRGAWNGYLIGELSFGDAT